MRHHNAPHSLLIPGTKLVVYIPGHRCIIPNYQIHINISVVIVQCLHICPIQHLVIPLYDLRLWRHSANYLNALHSPFQYPLIWYTTWSYSDEIVWCWLQTHPPPVLYSHSMPVVYHIPKYQARIFIIPRRKRTGDMVMVTVCPSVRPCVRASVSPSGSILSD